MLIRTTLFFGFWSFVLTAHAQVPPAVDYEDPIGQRLGWDVDKIALSVEKDGIFKFYRHIKNLEKGEGTTLLVFIDKSANSITSETCSNTLPHKKFSGAFPASKAAFDAG